MPHSPQRSARSLGLVFERSHALGKAFHYVDTSGRGYLPPDEFEKAVELVLTSDESHHCPGGGELTSSQVKHLVYSLRGSTLVDELSLIHI